MDPGRGPDPEGHDHTNTGPRPRLRRVVHGGARHARRHHRAHHDPPRPRGDDRAARVDGERLQPLLRRAADDRRRARRPLRPPAHVRRRHRALLARLCGVRARTDRRLADRRAHGAGRRRRAGDDARARARRAPPSRPSGAAGRSGSSSRLTGLAVASGPLVGGAVVEGLAWQWIFWLNVPIGARARRCRCCAGSRRATGRTRGSTSAALALVTLGLLGLVWGLVRGNPAGWGSAEVVGALAGGAVLVVAFVAWELRARAPMLPMRFFRARSFSAGNAAIFFAVGSLFCGVFFLAQFLQTGLGRGPLAAGLGLLPWTATLFFVAPGGRHARRPPRRAPVPGPRAAAPGGRDGLDRPDRRGRDALRRG